MYRDLYRFQLVCLIYTVITLTLIFIKPVALFFFIHVLLLFLMVQFTVVVEAYKKKIYDQLLFFICLILLVPIVLIEPSKKILPATSTYQGFVLLVIAAINIFMVLRMRGELEVETVISNKE